MQDMWEVITYHIRKNNDNCADVNNNEDNYSPVEGENDNRFSFVRSIPEDAPTTKWGISESEKRSLDGAAARC